MRETKIVSKRIFLSFPNQKPRKANLISWRHSYNVFFMYKNFIFYFLFFSFFIFYFYFLFLFYFFIISNFKKLVELSDFSFRLDFKFFKFFNFFPNFILKFCGYFVSISSALALLNVVPCFWLDGNHILNSMVEILSSRSPNNLVNHKKSRKLKIYLNIFMYFSSFLLLANLIISSWKVFG